MILVIDNYDSFTYNLVQYFGELGADPLVRRNDQITLTEIEAMAPERICISPGPCTPKEAGISSDVIRQFAGKMPILGVCLGHQCMGDVYGGEVVRAGRLMHGKTSPILHHSKDLFEGLPNPFEATRYHSLLVRRESLPDCLESPPRQPKAKLWDSVTAPFLSGGSSSIRNRSSPPTQGAPRQLSEAQSMRIRGRDLP